jgi:hypothetical protein
MFKSIWNDIKNNSILNHDIMYDLYCQVIICSQLSGITAEVGVYEGFTSKLIRTVAQKEHYCYDTFEGIINSSSLNEDYHQNGEFICNLDIVKQNINMDNVIYKKGCFPNSFNEYDKFFCFVYCDTGTYFGAINTYNSFKDNIVPGGKIIFFVDNHCKSIKNVIDIVNNKEFTISFMKNFIICTKL